MRGEERQQMTMLTLVWPNSSLSNRDFRRSRRS